MPYCCTPKHQALALYHQLRANLSRCIKLARQYVRSYNLTEYYTAEFRDKMDGTLEDVEKRLEAITRPDKA